VSPRTGLDDVEKRKFLPLPRLELRTLCRPTRSQSLYRLRYPGSSLDTDSVVKHPEKFKSIHSSAYRLNGYVASTETILLHFKLARLF
jgi:hypothetical protein